MFCCEPLSNVSINTDIFEDFILILTFKIKQVSKHVCVHMHTHKHTYTHIYRNTVPIEFKQRHQVALELEFHAVVTPRLGEIPS